MLRSGQAIEPDKFGIRITIPESTLAINAGNLSHFRQRASVVKALCPIKSSAVCNAPLRWALMAVAGLVFVVFAELCHAQPPARPALTPELLSRLTSEFRSSTDQTPLRETLESITAAAQINYWLDRRIDPTQAVSLGTQTSTPYEAIQKAASEAGLSVGAVDNIVVVGRSEWVQSLVAVILSTPPSSKVQRISWPEPSTPQAALAQAVPDSDVTLPHDLWGATQWNQLEQRIAAGLICAQFDRMLAEKSAQLKPIVAPERVLAIYPTSQQSLIQQSLTQSDPQSKFKVDKASWRAYARPAAHMAAVDAWIAQVAKAKPRNAKPMDIDRIKFPLLKVENVPAEQLLAQLAARCNRQATFSDEAKARCAKLITLELTDQSMRSVCDTLAASTRVVIEWTDQNMNITTSP